MAKISELTDGGSLLPTDTLIAVRSGSNVKVVNDTLNVTTLNPDQINMGDNEQIRMGNSQDLLIYHDGTNSRINDNGTGNLRLQTGGNTKLEVTSTGIDITGNAAFDDNGKAIFGAGSDLQIYHNGTTQDKIESSSAYLILEGSNIILRNNGGTEDYAKFFGNGAVELYSDNSKKLSTTSTGIDVTGSVTADGLTVSNSSLQVKLEEADGTYNPRLVTYFDSSGTHLQHTWSSGATNLIFEAGGSEGSGTERMRIDGSTGNVGIGTTSPSTPLHINTNVQAVAQLESAHANGSYAIWAVGGTKFGDVGSNKGISGSGNTTDFMVASRSTYPLILGTGSTERMRIDSSGNVKIGTGTDRFSYLTASTANLQIDGGLVFEPGSGNNAEILNYRTTAMIFGNGGSEDMRIDSSGNAGIGTSSPAKRVHIYDSTQANQAIRFGNPAATPYGEINYQSLGFEHLYISVKGTTTGYGNIVFSTGPTPTEAMRIDASGVVQISNATPTLKFTDTDNNYDATIQGLSGSLVLTADSGAEFGTESIQFKTGGQEVARLDASGNLLVGTTDTDTQNNNAGSTADNGFVYNIGSGGYLNVARYGGTVAYFNRTSTDGAIVDFRKDGSAKAGIGVAASVPYFINTQASGSGLRMGTGVIQPSDNAGAKSDATHDLGSSSGRFKDLYRSGSTISTSDRNMKQDERDLTEAETRVAQACKGLLKAFRFIDAVEVDGDNARIHFGIIAQDLQAAFEAEGLDATKYAMFRPSTYTDDQGAEQTRLGVCYENLLAFIIAAI